MLPANGLGLCTSVAYAMMGGHLSKGNAPRSQWLASNFTKWNEGPLSAVKLPSERHGLAGEVDSGAVVGWHTLSLHGTRLERARG